jgi:hypothetical protein
VPRPELLTAGPLSLELDGDDVRAVRFGDQEVVRRIYVGVRTPSWATVPGTVRDRVIASDGDRVRVELVTDHRQEDLAVEVRVVLVLDPAGELSYQAELEALSGFDYNRMGICVLHPGEESAGVPYWARGTDGETSGRLPRLIAPQDVRGGQNQPLFPAFEELELELDDLRVRLTCSGDRFETEDQRNWTDASFKTYSTPSGLGLPHAIAPGEVLSQQVTIAARGRPRSRAPVPGQVELGVDGASGRTLPALGIALPAGVEALAALAPAHLRVRLDLTGPEEEWRAALGEAARAAADRRGRPGGRAARPGPSRGALPAAAAALGDVAVPLHRVLVFPAEGGVTDDAWLRELREVVSPAVPGVPLGGGARATSPTSTAPCRAPRWTSWAGASTRRSTRPTRAPSWRRRPPRGSPSAPRWRCAPTRASPSARWPSAPGRRLDAGLGPAWAALSVRHLAEAGVAAVTFDLAGAGAPAPLEALAGRHGDEVLTTTSTDPARADVLAVRRGERTRMLVVNPTADPQAVELRHADDQPRQLTLEPYAVEVVDA